jgi:hypothetical protein
MERKRLHTTSVFKPPINVATHQRECKSRVEGLKALFKLPSLSCITNEEIPQIWWWLFYSRQSKSSIHTAVSEYTARVFLCFPM